MSYLTGQQLLGGCRFQGCLLRFQLQGCHTLLAELDLSPRKRSSLTARNVYIAFLR